MSVLAADGISQSRRLISIMESKAYKGVLCDDCSEKAEARVKAKFYCSPCAMRVLLSQSSCGQRELGSEWGRQGSLPQTETR